MQKIYFFILGLFLSCNGLFAAMFSKADPRYVAALNDPNYHKAWNDALDSKLSCNNKDPEFMITKAVKWFKYYELCLIDLVNANQNMAFNSATLLEHLDTIQKQALLIRPPCDAKSPCNSNSGDDGLLSDERFLIGGVYYVLFRRMEGFVNREADDRSKIKNDRIKVGSFDLKSATAIIQVSSEKMPEMITAAIARAKCLAALPPDEQPWSLPSWDFSASLSGAWLWVLGTGWWIKEKIGG